MSVFTMLEGRFMLERGASMDTPWRILAVKNPPPPWMDFPIPSNPIVRFMKEDEIFPDEMPPFRVFRFKLDCIIGGEALYYLDD